MVLRYQGATLASVATCPSIDQGRQPYHRKRCAPNHSKWLRSTCFRSESRSFRALFWYSLQSVDLDQLYAQWSNLHCNEAHIIAKVLALGESLDLFDDLLAQLKSGQSTTPIHSF
jgi:hypothetical protein